MDDTTTQTTIVEEETPKANGYSYDYDYVILGDPGQLVEIFETLVYTTGTLGVCSNLFVLVILCSSEHFRSKASYLLLINQTAADMFTSMMVIVTYATWFSGVSSNVHGVVGRIYCRLVNNEVLLYTGLYTSALNIVYMTAERLFMIVHPFVHRTSMTKGKAKVGSLCTWILGFCFNIPTIASGYHSGQACHLSYFLNSRVAQMVYGCTLSAVTFILPLMFMFYAYTHMIIILKRSSKSFAGNNASTEKQSSGSTPRKNISTAQMNLLKIMVIITVIFIVLWTPIQVYYLMYSVGMKLTFGDAYYYIAMALTIVNSTINPFVYILKYDQFQNQVKKLFGCKGYDSKGETSSVSNDTEASKI